jgi:hypothetical protein
VILKDGDEHWLASTGARDQHRSVTHGGFIRLGFEYLFDPAYLLGALTFAITGKERLLGRDCYSIRAERRPGARRIGSYRHGLGQGDAYAFEVDCTTGILLRAAMELQGAERVVHEIRALELDGNVPEELFQSDALVDPDAFAFGTAYPL